MDAVAVLLPAIDATKEAGGAGLLVRATNDAVSCGQTAVLTQLLDAKADLADVNIAHAAYRGHDTMVAKLLGAKVSPNGTTTMSALALAAGEGHATIVAALLAAKATAGLFDERGPTALVATAHHCKNKKNAFNILEQLIGAKADVNVRGTLPNIGGTGVAVHLVARRKEAKLMSLLLDAKATVETNFAVASAIGNNWTKGLKILLDAKVSANGAPDTGELPLPLQVAMYARALSDRQKLSAVRVLVKAKADPQTVSRSPHFPLSPLAQAERSGASMRAILKVLQQAVVDDANK